ncbi:hypothetical protein [Butyrivibrio sp. VCB2006]|uniref:hypothetical protein n=1 Tax=Butyrivibrio sp. VCB2006 TaxID=1280679 RepID=UPI00040B0022|nr:hypothetical protein [Butyrivibrio sp. VCB2006]
MNIEELRDDRVVAIFLPIMALIVGHIFTPTILASVFVVTEIVFSIVLAIEVKKLR